MSVFHLLFFRCHSVSPKWGFHKRFRCPITLPNRLAQLDVLLLCNHIVHYIRLSFRFQSSLPRGERLRYGTRCRICYDFNPRSREGSDFYRKSKEINRGDFNPRSREGSDTICLIRTLEPCRYFNPRSREGSDIHWPMLYLTRTNFNPRSREGSDTRVVFALAHRWISIHAPARGATLG